MEISNPKFIKDNKYDVVIVGTGPAGTSLLDSLKDSRKRILILEAGFEDFQDTSQKFYKGKTSGFPHSDLEIYRKRELGGSSNCWGGGCAPFDEIDFLIEEDSRKVWPISLRDLKPFYQEAGEFYGIGNYYEIKNIPRIFKNEIKSIKQSYGLVNEKEKTFKPRYKKIISDSQNIDLCLKANVVDIGFSDETNRIKFIQVVDYEGFKKNIYAEKFILCCGGIESTRLLLNWTEKYKQLDQIKGNLGHYYSPHINIECGKLISSPNQILNTEFVDLNKDISCHAYFSLLFNKNEQKRFLNSKWHLAKDSLKANPRKYMKYILTGNMSLNKNKKELSDKEKMIDSLLLNYLSINDKKGEIYNLNTIFDQTPTRDSRIELINNKDELQLKKVNLHYQINDEDIQKLKNTCTEVARLVGLNNIGRVKICNIESYLKENEIGFSHHTGTIRMANNKSFGCVDKNLKIFEVENLWVCSSAVFPSPSQASPTFTIMAMAKRLSKEIKNEFN